MMDLFFSHCLIMRRSQNWPDLRSLRSKIRDIRFVGNDGFMISWNLYMDRSRTVSTVASQIFQEIGSLDLTWDDPGTKFSEKVRNWWLISNAKNGGASRRRFFAILEKPQVGEFKHLPPSRARVNIASKVGKYKHTYIAIYLLEM